MLLGWLRSIKAASTPDVRHIAYFVGEDPPDWWKGEAGEINMETISRHEEPGKSIGYYHNLGAVQAHTEWIMKLDVDTVPCVQFFKHLLPVLQSAGPRDWFNAGMLYLSRNTTDRLTFPVREDDYKRIVSTPRLYTSSNGWYPQATNFVCRRNDYVKLGGSHSGFRHYGWEDYQQIYMLEKHRLGVDPLPGPVDMANVTQRCRDEIGKKKAAELFNRDRFLCLFHRWHPPSSNPDYKNPVQLERNRKVLLDYVLNSRRGS